MNFVDAVLSKNNDGVFLDFNGETVKLPEGKASNPALDEYIGKTVVLGIRPDDMGDSALELETNKDSVVETDVTGYELLGSEVILYFNIAGVAMCAKVSSATEARLGDHIKLAMDANKIHVFDKETELTITN